MLPHSGCLNYFAVVSASLRLQGFWKKDNAVQEHFDYKDHYHRDQGLLLCMAGLAKRLQIQIQINRIN